MIYAHKPRRIMSIPRVTRKGLIPSNTCKLALISPITHPNKRMIIMAAGGLTISGNHLNMAIAPMIGAMAKVDS
jgi:hypothetical protein